MTTANLIEVLDVSERVRAVPIARTMAALEPLFDSTLTVRRLDLSGARRAAEIRARHYHRATRPISLADCVLLAAAGSGDVIATADPDVLAVAGYEKIDALELPAQG